MGESLNEIGGRLRRIRRSRDMTLSDVAEATGVSISTISRLESGDRRATLELLLTLTSLYGLPLQQIVGDVSDNDPLIRSDPIMRGDAIITPLSHHSNPFSALKLVLPPNYELPRLHSHRGPEWIYVLSGELRLISGDINLLLEPGEVVDLDADVPHWFGTTENTSVELIILLGLPGQKSHFDGGISVSNPSI